MNETEFILYVSKQKKAGSFMDEGIIIMISRD
jgi:hypothetical protein